MAGQFDNFIEQLSTGDTMRDYQHASRTFVDSLYRLSPKFNSLFHVYIDLLPEDRDHKSDRASALIANATDPNKTVEVGLMAKTVSLPNFRVQTKTYNAYNRKNIAQERITYEPVRMTFHDDSADVVRDFWQRYYEYHYRDSDHGSQGSTSSYSAAHKYQERQQSTWGFSPITPSNEAYINYIAAIRIYSLHQKSFSSYTLINPTITEFSHGELTQGDYGLLEHTMAAEYEAVLYDSGPVNKGTVIGWNHAHYDNTLSPLKAAGGGTASILGPGGLIDGIAGGDGDLLTAALAAARAGTTWENRNLKDVAASEFYTLSRNILQGRNSRSEIFAPTGASITDALTQARYKGPGQ